MDLWKKGYAILNGFSQGQALQTTPKEFAMTLYQSKILRQVSNDIVLRFSMKTSYYCVKLAFKDKSKFFHIFNHSNKQYIPYEDYWS